MNGKNAQFLKTKTMTLISLLLAASAYSARAPKRQRAAAHRKLRKQHNSQTKTRKNRAARTLFIEIEPPKSTRANTFPNI